MSARAKAKFYQVMGRGIVDYKTTFRAARGIATDLARQHRGYEFIVNRCTLIEVRPAELAVKLLTGGWCQSSEVMYRVRRNPNQRAPRRTRSDGADQAQTSSSAIG